MKYIVVTGGVISGLGKGITISSIGKLLKASGVRTTSIKIDPYLNVDAGTMSPFEHGETFVLDDGGETDLDLGNYERFLDITLSSRHNITTGKIFQEAIHRERRGDYLGKTVQIVPHVTDVVQCWISEVAKIPVDGTNDEPEVCLIEVGGTVGDIESMVFLEALRQFQFTVGKENFLLVHVSLVPCMGADHEQKTKPTQHSVKELRTVGLFPDIIVCRSSDMVLESTKNKISIFCHVPASHVLSVHDVSNIFHVPLILVQQQAHKLIREKLSLTTMTEEPDLLAWSAMASSVDHLPVSIDIAIVGKYTGNSDAYLSVTKSLRHSGVMLNVNVNLVWVEATDLEDAVRESNPEKHAAAWTSLRATAAIVIPGGFGERGVEGMVLAAHYGRTSGTPLLGVCLGMQVMVIEYARSILGLTDAHSAEFVPTCAHPAVVFMPEISTTVMGGTMRLGARPTTVRRLLSASSSSTDTTLAWDVYGLAEETASTRESGVVIERHRHRYEVNPDIVVALEEVGLQFTGRDDTGVRMEVVELARSTHPYYLGVQYHPEFKSRPASPSPVFFGLVAVAAGRAAELGGAGSSWQMREKARVVPTAAALTAPELSSAVSKSLLSPLMRAGKGRAASLGNALELTANGTAEKAKTCLPVPGWNEGEPVTPSSSPSSSASKSRRLF